MASAADLLSAPRRQCIDISRVADWSYIFVRFSVRTNRISSIRFCGSPGGCKSSDRGGTLVAVIGTRLGTENWTLGRPVVNSSEMDLTLIDINFNCFSSQNAARLPIFQKCF